MVCRGKTRERRGDKGLNGNSSPCVPLPPTAAGRLVSPILDSSAAPTLSVPSPGSCSFLPLLLHPPQVAAEVLPFHSLTPDAPPTRVPRRLGVRRLFVVFIWRSGPFTGTLQTGARPSRGKSKRLCYRTPGRRANMLNGFNI